MAAATLHKGKYLSDIILNYEIGTAPAAAPTSFFVALLTAMPTTNAGAGIAEVSTTGTGYARQPITNAQWAALTTLADNFSEASASTVALTWTNSGATPFGTIVGIALFDAVTAGNDWMFGQLADGSGNATSYVISAGNTFTIPAGSLKRQES